jgi:predicted branched-subunit amino acid permease
VIFSAGWRRYFGTLPRGQRLRMAYFAADLNYALVLKRYPVPPATSQSVPYFWGGVSLNFPAWHVPSLIGLLVGERIPTQWGLGFAGALALLGLTYAMLHDRATWIAAAVAGAAAVATFALPLRLNILVAIAAAVVVGLLVDHTTKRAAQPEEDLT